MGGQQWVSGRMLREANGVGILDFGRAYLEHCDGDTRKHSAVTSDDSEGELGRMERCRVVVPHDPIVVEVLA
jgi:hypothetical protein